jgi:hypothetical protein
MAVVGTRDRCLFVCGTVGWNCGNRGNSVLASSDLQYQLNTTQNELYRVVRVL